jgi:hypothetical protein
VTLIGAEFLERNRLDEISRWVEENEDKIEKWIAVDDLDLSELGEEHFVHTKRPREGIKQTGIKDKILKLLK